MPYCSDARCIFAYSLFHVFHHWELKKRKNAATVRSASGDPAKKKEMVRVEHMEGRDSGIACLGKLWETGTEKDS